MLKEFRDFAMKGNLIDIAVGFVMGAAFTKLTSSFINGMIMPLVGMLQGKDLSDWKLVLKEAVIKEDGSVAQGEVAITYGTFISVFIEFLIVAFVMFLVVRGINRMKRKKAEAPAAPATPPVQEVLLSEIRDLLKNR